jgi:hypothetical protein
MTLLHFTRICFSPLHPDAADFLRCWSKLHDNIRKEVSYFAEVCCSGFRSGTGYKNCKLYLQIARPSGDPYNASNNHKVTTHRGADRPSQVQHIASATWALACYNCQPATANEPKTQVF